MKTSTGLLIAAGTALKVGGDVMINSSEQRFKEKLERLRNAQRDKERQEDRDQRDKERGEDQFGTLASKAQDLTARRESDAAADVRAEEDRKSREKQSRDSLAAQSNRGEEAYLELIERDGGTLAVLDKRTSKITPVMDGDVPVRGKKANAVPMPREGLSASDDRYMEALERQEGYDPRRRYSAQDRDAIFGRVAAKARAAGREDIARYYDPLPAPAAESPPGSRPTAAPAATDAAPAPKPAPADQAPAAPRDPAQREVGKTYRAPSDGRLVKWTGRGWEPVQQ